MDRLTVAPAPSDCSRARKTFWMPLGFGEAALREGSSGGMTGSPTKGAIVECDLLVFRFRVFDMLFNVFDFRKGRIYSSSRCSL